VVKLYLVNSRGALPSAAFWKVLTHVGWMQMVEELIREDGMCVMSAGMGWQKAVAVILRLHMERRRWVKLGTSQWSSCCATSSTHRGVDVPMPGSEAQLLHAGKQPSRV